MRVSSYVVATPLQERAYYLLLHGYTGAVDKVGEGVGRFLLDNRGREVETRAMVEAGVEPALIDALASRGYLTDRTHADERGAVVSLADALHEAALARARTGFIFVPSYRCNLRCPYCFQPHPMHSGRGKFGAVMTREQVDQAFAIIDGFGGPGAMARALDMAPALAAQPAAQREIGLFGGEPLTEPLVPIVTYILEEAVSRGFTLSAITNGVDLHHFAHLLGPKTLREVQVTLDGPPGHHNKRRIGPGLHDTFDRIVDNIDLALQRKVQVTLRINTDATNLPSLGELDDLFAARGWKGNPNFMAGAAVVTPEAVHKELIDRPTLARETRRLQRERESCIGSYERYAVDTLQACLAGDGYPFQHIVNCSAETGLLMFDALGDVYACWEDIGELEHRIGAYGPEGLTLFKDQVSTWLRRFPGAIEQCSNCPYALIHASGCGKHARNETGSLFASDCDGFQRLFPETLADAYQDFEALVRAAPSSRAATNLSSKVESHDG